MEIRWWRRYLARRDRQVYLDWKSAYWRRLLTEHALWPRPGATVLDAGCGPAGVFMVLPDHAVDAIDPLLAAYAEKLPHFLPADYPRTRFITTALEDFAPPKTYDQVFCLNSLNHVSDLSQCLHRLAVLTRPGGRLVVTVDAHRHSWLRRLFHLLPGDVLHPQQYLSAQYQTMLAAHGFAISLATTLHGEQIFDYILLVAERTAKA